MDAFADPDTKDPVSPFVQLLWERGTTFESEVVAGLEDPFTDLSQLRGQEKEGAMRAAIAAGDRLIYSGRLSLDDLLGEPDILRREGPGYVAIDIKSGAGKEGSDEGTDDYGKPKKHYGVQIALYTDILVRLGISAGRYGFIWDIHRQEKRYDLDTPLGPKSPCLWEIYLEVTAVVASALLAPGTTQPAAASACKLCVWRSNCLSELKTGQDLTLLPELGRSRRDTLVAQFPTLPDLAHADVERFMKPKNKTDFPGIGADMLRKYRARAVLAIADNPVPYLTKSIAWPTAPAELFFDIETDSMRNLCYLHGFVIREGSKTRGERFEAIYVADLTKNAERVAFAAAMAIFRRYSEAVIVHYSKY